jgi:enoyl-CoA hydratase/carnithine racemase
MQAGECFEVRAAEGVRILQLRSADGRNRLTRSCVQELIAAIAELAGQALPLVISGNEKFFSAGADLNEIALLGGREAVDFSRLGQHLMDAIENFPAPVCAAVHGYCMGGGLDLALACGYRVAAPQAIFGHRGAALGLITGWGGTQQLPRLVGKARALQMFVAAEKVNAPEALRAGLVDAIAADPGQWALRRLRQAESSR